MYNLRRDFGEAFDSCLLILTLTVECCLNLNVSSFLPRILSVYKIFHFPNSESVGRAATKHEWRLGRPVTRCRTPDLPTEGQLLHLEFTINRTGFGNCYEDVVNVYKFWQRIWWKWRNNKELWISLKSNAALSN